MKRLHLGVGAAALVLLYFLLGFHPIWDIDVFWHIAAGRWIWQHRALPSTDIFSAVDPARVWVTFQWLYEVLVHVVERVGGLTGVRALHAGVIAAALGLWSVVVGRARGAWFGLMGGAVLALLFADRLRVRPDAFNLLFMVVLWPCLTAPRWTRLHLVWLAALAAAWANLHAGGSLLLPILVVARLAGRAADRVRKADGGARLNAAWRELRFELPAFVGLVALMAVMPGFLQGTYQAFFMLGPSESFIPEWMTSIEFLFDHAATAHEWLAGLLPMVLLAAVLGGEAVRLRRRRPSADMVLKVALAMPLVALSLRHVRFLWLAAFLVPMLPTWSLDGLRQRMWKLAPALVALLLLGLDVHYHVVRNGGGWRATVDGLGQDLEPGAFPEAAADFLVASGFKGRILNHAAWGGYLLYRLYPDATVFTDGRGNFGPVETQLLATWDSTVRRRVAIERAWQAAPFEAVVHPAPFPLHSMDCREWLQVYHDPLAAIYLRSTPTNVGNLKSMGAWLPPGSGFSADDGCGLHRAFTAVFAGHRLRSGEQFWARTRLAAAADEPRALLALAAIHFDLGDYPWVISRLTREQDGLDANAAFLVGFANLALGYRDAAMAQLARLQHDPGLTPPSAAILQYILAGSSSP